MTMTTTPISRYRDLLIDETNHLQRERAELAVIGPTLARLEAKRTKDDGGDDGR